MSTNWTDVKPYFETTAVVHIGTLMPDGAPHTVPVWAGVEGELVTVFMAAGCLKDKNLIADPRVALSVTHPERTLDMAFIRGTVEQRVEGDDALPIVDRISELYTGAPYELRTGLVAYYFRPAKMWERAYAE